jgi:Na+/melibiose symporter-like transporter
MGTSVEANQKDSILGSKEKLAFLSVNLGNIPIMTMLSYFLLLFYTDVAGLNPVGIGTLFLIARVMDGVSDPIMGYVIDHLPCTKMDRFRGYLLIGVIFTTLNFLLLWLGPSLATTGKLAIAYISYLLIGWTFDLMDIPLNSMIPVMSDREKDRNTPSILKGVGLSGRGSRHC